MLSSGSSRGRRREYAILAFVGVLCALFLQRLLRVTSATPSYNVNFDESFLADLLFQAPRNDNNTFTTETTSFDGVQPRTFASWPRDLVLPCYSPYDDVKRPRQQDWNARPVLKQPAHEGLFFLKLCKTASSTAASVHLRIARNLAKRQQHDKWPICKARFLHGWAGPKMYQFAQRNRTASFLWTMLRQPTSRYISEFWHFYVTRKSVPVTAPALQRFLRRGEHSDHHSLSWLSVHGYQYGKSNPIATAQDILRDYDFIGVAERFDESIVVLSLLLGVPLADVLYLSSKVTGGYDALCYKLRKGQLSPPMQRLLQTQEWQTYIAPEVALHQAANASLDLTIEKLGRARVQDLVQQFQTLNREVQNVCGPVTKFPCNATTGQPSGSTDCLHGDMGCGLDCIDRVVEAASDATPEV